MSKSPNLSGKTILITNGSSELGEVIAKELAGYGAHVTILVPQQGLLKNAKQDMNMACARSTQDIHTVGDDFVSSKQVNEADGRRTRLPDLRLYSVISAVDEPVFIVCGDSASAAALCADTNGPSPRLTTYIGDTLLFVVTRWFIQPYLKWKWRGVPWSDGKTQHYEPTATWWDRFTWKFVRNF